MMSSKDESATDSDNSSAEVPDSNSSVLAYNGPRINVSKVQKAELIENELRRYFVHYLGSNNWDEQVGTERLMKLTDENIMKQQALDKKQGVDKNANSGRSSQTKPENSADPKIEKDDTKNSELNLEGLGNVEEGGNKEEGQGTSTTDSDFGEAELNSEGLGNAEEGGDLVQGLGNVDLGEEPNQDGQEIPIEGEVNVGGDGDPIMGKIIPIYVGINDGERFVANIYLLDSDGYISCARKIQETLDIERRNRLFQPWRSRFQARRTRIQLSTGRRGAS